MQLHVGSVNNPNCCKHEHIRSTYQNPSEFEKVDVKEACLKIMAMQQAVVEQHWAAEQQEIEKHYAWAVMQVNTAGVTKPPIQSNKAVEELVNEDPAPTPLCCQGTWARQPMKCVEASTTQPNKKWVRRVWGCGIRQCFICRQNRVL